MNQRDLEVVDAVRMDTIDPLLRGLDLPDGSARISIGDYRCCILGTRLALEVLKTYSIFGRALKVHALIYNASGWAWQKDNPERPLLGELGEAEGEAVERWGEDATIDNCWPLLEARGIPASARLRFCGLGTDMPDTTGFTTPGWLNGHCVALLDLDGTPILLDTTAQQFTTPEFKLFVPPVIFEAPADWARDPSSSWATVEPEELNGGAMLYRQPRDLQGVFDAADWLGPGYPAARQTIEAIRGQVEERLALMRL